MTRLLVLAPHPDDEAIGAGGTIANVLANGGAATVLVVQANDPDRVKESFVGAERLGGADVFTLIEDRLWVDDMPLFDLVGPIEHFVAEWEPDVVLIPSAHSAHQEHQAVAKAAAAALRPAGGTGVHLPPVVAAYEQPADVWSTGQPNTPNWFVPLERDEMIRKLDSLAAHASQTRPEPSERSPQAIEALARLRGAQVGTLFAEAHTILRWVGGL